MSDQLKCGTPPRRFTQAGQDWIESCNQTPRVWDVSKNGHTAQLVRCDECAGKLRKNGYDVRIAAKKESGKKSWDMTSTHSLEAGAEWMRSSSKALLVLIVRDNDAVLAVAAGIRPADIEGMLYAGLPDAIAYRARPAAEKRTNQPNEVQR